MKEAVVHHARQVAQQHQRMMVLHMGKNMKRVQILKNNKKDGKGSGWPYLRSLIRYNAVKWIVILRVRTPEPPGSLRRANNQSAGLRK
jgi:hypothetical protein